MSMTFTHAWVMTGAWNFALLGVAGATQLRRAAPATAKPVWSTSFFLTAAVALIAVSVAHQSEGPVQQWAWRFGGLIFLIGPLLYGTVRSLLDAALPSVAARIHILGGIVLALAGKSLGFPQLLAVQLTCYLVLTVRCRLPLRRRNPTRLADALIALVMLMAAAEAARVGDPAGVNCNTVLIAAAVGSTGLLLFILAGRTDLLRVNGAYAKAGVPPGKLEGIWSAIERQFHDDHLYRRPDLTLRALAMAVGVTPQQASQAISQVGASSFREFVSRARIEDAKRRLLSPANQHVAIEPIGMESGFRSRSAFYAAFKQATGLTPAEFRDRTIAS